MKGVHQHETTPPPTTLRARLASRGGGGARGPRLLEILGVPADAELIATVGGLRGMLDAPDERPASALLAEEQRAKLKAVVELARRWHEARLARKSNTLASPDETAWYVTAQLRGCAEEVFGCLFLDSQHRVIAWEELFRGTVDGASVYPRVVARRALAVNAAAVIGAHNHPSGVAEPSNADRAITGKLREALALVDVRLLDHLVVGDGEIVSFTARGWL